MTPQQLKASLLQEAIQGKLTDQRPEDGSAEDLYRAILAEKKRLIKAGKLKKEKPLPPIEEKDIPFDIPENWKWVRLGEITLIERGGSPRPIKSYLTNSSDGINWIKIGDSDKNGKYICSTAEKIKPEAVSKSRRVNKGDLLLTNSMSYGRPYILKTDGCIHDGWLVVSQYLTVFVQDFLYYLLLSGCARTQFAQKAQGAVVKNLNIEKVSAAILPLPPLAEQERIVAKLEELLPLVERYGKAYTQLTALEQRFPASMRKSLLQEAIQGKLTDQRPEDGSAEELYRSILAEKKRLIKAGKLKKEKPLPPIEEKDIPFDIPENWKWVRLGEVAMRISKGTTPRGASAVYKNAGIGFLRAENIAGGDCLDLSNLKYIDKETHTGVLSRSILQVNDILITIAGTLGRTGLVRAQNLPLNANQAVSFVRPLPSATPCISFFCIALNAPIIQRKLTRQERVTAIPNLTLEMISSCVIPLPPLAEQERIVAKLEELLPLCD